MWKIEKKKTIKDIEEFINSTENIPRKFYLNEKNMFQKIKCKPKEYNTLKVNISSESYIFVKELGAWSCYIPEELQRIQLVLNSSDNYNKDNNVIELELGEKRYVLFIDKRNNQKIIFIIYIQKNINKYKNVFAFNFVFHDVF